MDTKEFKDDLNKGFSDFEAFQGELLNLINSGDRDAFLNNLDSFQNRINVYNEVIRKLVDELVLRLQKGEIPIEEGIYWNDRLKVLMDNLSIIYFEMEKIKISLQEEAKSLAKGKSVIMSYHSKENKKPFFLSDDA